MSLTRGILPDKSKPFGTVRFAKDINSWLSRLSTARGSGTGLMTVGLTIVKAFITKQCLHSCLTEVNKGK